MHVDYASGSRFYVESGGSLVGLRQGIRECTAYAESGALIERRDGLKVIAVPSIRRAYADRDKPVFLEKGPGGILPAHARGAGAELITINDRFDEAADEDVNFVAQVFAGIRVSLASSIDASVGVRRTFREGLSLLGDQFSTEDAWGFEAGIGYRF